ncbi:hypothetical protein [Gymnodinialimonas ceratoperidinii]|uniref:Uncharacterized protein n=1 Tax=Gymnodinialimonas ceratoperidinii TaxID=2856823 RepID=A0A8F6TWY5_9RHOB|nr:hypothetical protein [Gymnodinialimonas ceratoperidinii]QXT39241.1 hypothetical protein KYE46_15140 [Gymnodinialimonas ceratoperidinii]
MSFYSVSHWETTDWTDEMEALARDKYVPLVKGLGAESVNMVRTGDRTFIVVTKYADQAAGEAAQARIDEIRTEAAEELPMKMSSVERGSTFASG